MFAIQTGFKGMSFYCTGSRRIGPHLDIRAVVWFWLVHPCDLLVVSTH